MTMRALSAGVTAVSFVALHTHAIAGEASTPAANPVPEQVVITASPLTTDPNGLATPVERVNRDRILQSGASNIADTLTDLPGISATTYASGASRPVIRGFDASRVRILEGGVGTFDVSDIGPDHAVPTGPLGTERIEVVRGAATVRYGSQAIGGVVNAISNRIPLALPSEAFSGEVSGSFGSVSSSGDGSALIDARAGQFALHADSYIRTTGDYDTPDGRQPNSYFKGDGASVGSSYFSGGSRVGAAVIHYDSLYGIPSDIAHIKMQQTKGLFGSSFDVGQGAFKTLTVDGGYGDYRHDEINPGGSIAATFKDKEWDTRAEGIFGQIGPFSASAFGIQFQRRDFSALGEGLNFLFPTVTASEAGFAFSELPLSDKLKMQIGARAEQALVKGTPASLVRVRRSYTPLSGSAGLLHNPTETMTLGLTLSSAARAPNAVELFAHGPHNGPGTFETGNPNLGIERANSLEATVRLHASGVEIEGALWGVTFPSYIHGRLTGNTCDEDGDCNFPGPGDYKELFYEQGGARFWGVEGKAAGTLADFASGTVVGDIVADYVRATLRSGGDVPLVQPYHVGVGLIWQSDVLDADVHVFHTGAQSHTGKGLTPTKAFLSLDAGITWRPQRTLSGLVFSLVGKNLTDSRKRNASALNRDLVELPGRDIRIVTRYVF